MHFFLNILKMKMNSYRYILSLTCSEVNRFLLNKLFIYEMIVTVLKREDVTLCGLLIIGKIMK